MESWLTLSKSKTQRDKSNSDSLFQEAQITLNEIDSFLKTFELFGRITSKNKRRKY